MNDWNWRFIIEMILLLVVVTVIIAVVQWVFENLGRFEDSYNHYRTKVGLGRIRSLYRTFYFEFKHKEPWG